MKVKKNIIVKNLVENKSESEEDKKNSMDDEESNDSDRDNEEDINMGEEEEGVTDGSDGSSEGVVDSDEDLGASATESDADDSEDEGDKTPTSKSEIVKKSLLEKYQETNGKRLYIRFPRSIPAEELVQKAKDLSPLIADVNKPRQKYSRFCMVYFQNQDDREVTLKDLKKRIKKGELEKYHVDIPKTENPEYVELLAQIKTKSLENKKLKARLKKVSKKAGTLNTFTSSVLVFNLPKTATVIQLRELFPTAVDVHIKTIKGGANKDKSVASITLPSTMEARAAANNKLLSMGGAQLTVKFDNKKIKNKKTKKMKLKQIGSKESNMSTGAKQTSPTKKSKLHTPEKKQKGPIIHTKLEVKTVDNGKSANNKRKLPQTEVQALKKKLKNPQNKIAQKKYLHKQQKQ